MEAQNLEKDSFIRKLKDWNSQAVAEVIDFRGETTVVVPRELLRSTTKMKLGGERDERFKKPKIEPDGVPIRHGRLLRRWAYHL